MQTKPGEVNSSKKGQGNSNCSMELIGFLWNSWRGKTIWYVGKNSCRKHRKYSDKEITILLIIYFLCVLHENVLDMDRSKVLHVHTLFTEKND